jgi:hypothetical protein
LCQAWLKLANWCYRSSQNVVKSTDRWAENDCLIVPAYCLIPLENFSFTIYGYMNILQNLLLWPMRIVFEKGGIFIIPHLLWHEVLVYAVSSKGQPHSVASYNKEDILRTYINPQHHIFNVYPFVIYIHMYVHFQYMIIFSLTWTIHIQTAWVSEIWWNKEEIFHA